MEQEATQEKKPMRVRTNAEREADFLEWYISYIDDRNSYSFQGRHLEEEFIRGPQRRRQDRLWRVSKQAYEYRKKAGVYDVCKHGMPYDTHKTGECGCH
jgi:hypothetical protein